VSILKDGFGDGTRSNESFNEALIKADSLHRTRTPAGRKNERIKSRIKRCVDGQNVKTRRLILAIRNLQVVYGKRCVCELENMERSTLVVTIFYNQVALIIEGHIYV